MRLMLLNALLVMSSIVEPTSGDADSVPGDGSPTCPPDFPVKATDRTGLYQVQGDEGYEQIVPSTCYADENAAKREGYQRGQA